MASKEPIVFIDGEYFPKSRAKVSVFDHGLLYGDGVFEGIRVYGGIVFLFEDHVDRLYRSAKSVKMSIPVSREELVEVVLETLRKNQLKDAYIRLVVTRGVGDLGVDPRKCKQASLIIIAEHVEPAHGLKARQNGISVTVSSVRRDIVDGTSHEIKSLNYMNSIMAKLDAFEAGADDAIMLDHRGFVSEATTTNLFVVKDSEFVTPPSTAAILHGVTRKRVIRLIRDLGYRLLERDMTPFELVNADEAFLTGTLAEIVPVVKVKGLQIGDGRPGPTTRNIIDAFDRLKGDPREGTPVYTVSAIPSKK